MSKVGYEANEVNASMDLYGSYGVPRGQNKGQIHELH